ncbi:MAG: lysine--tRNA ligase [Bacillota bacterium]|nr:lysine--tRNA ligase [Bacillota bacterium]
MAGEVNSLNSSEEQENLTEILRVRREKLAELQQEGHDPFEITKYIVTHHTTDVKDNFETTEGKLVSLAGRIMSKRDMGKASFCDILDKKGRIQLYVRIDEVGEESYARFRKFDIGDIVGAAGTVFKTKRGEISIHVTEITLLSKSLKPLPEKFHGLKDQDLRYRQRYVDLIVNPEVRRTFEIRSAVIKSIRSYLDDRGYMEVETPVLNTIPGGATARPFITHHNTLDIDMYLRIATELHLKRLIVGGLERVYEIGRIFRNEGMSVKHNPEFTTIELYEAYADYHDMMDITEGIITNAAEKVLGGCKVVYQGEEIDLSPGWARMTMTEAVKKYTGVDFSEIPDDAAAQKAVRAAGVEFEGCPSRGDLLSFMFEEKVEEKLLQPTFITDYPVEVSPLAKRKKDDKRLTERFELFIARRELANAFSELNDPIDQKERFMRQAQLRASGDEEANMMDDDYINALEYGLSPTGGMGMGIDRLVMLFTDSASIRDVLLFPTMKPSD